MDQFPKLMIPKLPDIKPIEMPKQVIKPILDPMLPDPTRFMGPSADFGGQKFEFKLPIPKEVET
jgi:hypothetical protein